MSCSTNGCNNKVIALALCWKHYARFRRTGTVEYTPEDRLLSVGWIVTDAGCWEWNGPRTSSGYGRLQKKGVGRGAHRIAYDRWVRPIPEGHVVRHKCDNPPCINPEHLETGTPADNVTDRELRGRTSRGQRHYAAKLTEQDVLDIREEYAKGVLTQKMLAEVYGVGQAMISSIVRGSKWRHLTPPNSGDSICKTEGTSSP